MQLPGWFWLRKPDSEQLTLTRDLINLYSWKFHSLYLKSPYRLSSLLRLQVYFRLMPLSLQKFTTASKIIQIVGLQLCAPSSIICRDVTAVCLLCLATAHFSNFTVTSLRMKWQLAPFWLFLATEA